MIQHTCYGKALVAPWLIEGERRSRRESWSVGIGRYSGTRERNSGRGRRGGEGVRERGGHREVERGGSLEGI